MISPFASESLAAQARLVGAAATLALFGAACGGGVSASAKGSASADSEGSAEADFDAGANASAEGEGQGAWDTTAATQSEEQTAANAEPSTPQASQAPAEVALLGARHDLMVKQGAPQPCACLAVVVGPPSSSHMAWAGRAPTIDPSRQTVIALGSDGVSCNETGPGASYMGYVKKDGNVIVSVEAAVAGRPITHGAIIPKPDPGKQIYVQPDGKIPYGRGKGGEPRCAVGAGG